MTQASYLEYLDGWRGIAICLLLIGHFFPIPGISLDSVGVSFFFVLSGHLMTGLLFIKNTPLASFYRRRISRIFPVHIAYILAVCCAFTIFKWPANWSEVPAALFFVKNYFFFEKGHPDTLPFGHLWSLAVEEHAYIILSIVAYLSRHKIVAHVNAIAFLILSCISCGIWYALHYEGKELVFGHWLRTEVSAYGIFASAFLTIFFHQRKTPRLRGAAYLAIIAAAFATQWWSVPLPVKTFVGVGLLALAVNLLGAAPDFIKTALSWKPLRMMGIWSYSLYIWQQPFYSRYTANDWLSQCTHLAMAIALGIISFHVLEQPVRQWLNRNWGSNARTPA